MFSCGAVLSGRWIVVTDFLHYLARAKITSYLIMAPDKWIINPAAGFGNFPGRLSIFEEFLANSSDKSLLIYPLFLFLFDPFIAVLTRPMKTGGYSNLFELHQFLQPFNFTSKSLTMLEVLFLFL